MFKNPSANAQHGGSQKNVSRPLFAAVFLAGLAAGAAIGYFGIKNEKDTAEFRGKEVHQNDPRYTFTNPLLSCEIAGESVQYSELKPFRQELEKVVQEEIGKGHAESIAVYFRDLNNGPWFGIGEDEDFSPGSLLKVPLMIAWLKLAESDPAVLQRSVVAQFAEDDNMRETFRPREAIENGKPYTIDELMRRMVIYSDNNAASVLIKNINTDFLLNTYVELGVIIPGVRTLKDPIPVKRYAALFRILFNASYLDRNFSEKMLEVLSGSDFQTGLVAGVPSGVTVAHKFGERSFGPGKNQLHDCGIVYYPKHPYLLCVMSKGANLEMLDDSIAHVSRFLYEEVKGGFGK